MSESSSGQIVSSHFLKLVLGVVSLIAFAMLACNGSDGESVSTPTAPPGMFSTLPTTESPVLGDQPPTVELNTQEPTYTPNPTYSAPCIVSPPRATGAGAPPSHAVAPRSATQSAV